MTHSRYTVTFKDRQRRIARIDLDRLARIYGEMVAFEVVQHLLKRRRSHLSRA